ncbi:hypothetical protein [Proteiniclasticum sp.]|uniref:hypothetical protein n=1 Tax=Proteiniclasticum sp. TaxID=2053595 RepID=UPI00289CB480|nr:hypothetical protein [Proteiniclasticum sp.]
MESIVQIFDKMNSESKYQIITTTIGLIMPSLIYLTFNFPIQLYNSDFFILFIMSICVNFAVISILGLYSVLVKLNSYKEHSTFIESSSNGLNDHIARLRENTNIHKETIKQLNISLDEETTNTLKKELYDNEIELGKIENLHKQFISYLEDLLNPLKYLSEASIFFTMYILLISLLNIILKIDVDFTVTGIFNNVSLQFIVYFFIILKFDRYHKNPRYIHLKENFEAYNII